MTTHQSLNLRNQRALPSRLEGLCSANVVDNDAENDADDDDDDVTTPPGEATPFGSGVSVVGGGGVGGGQHCGSETPLPPNDEHLALPSPDPHSPAAWQAQRRAQQRARQHQRINENDRG